MSSTGVTGGMPSGCTRLPSSRYIRKASNAVEPARPVHAIGQIYRVGHGDDDENAEGKKKPVQFHPGEEGIYSAVAGK